jgi:hypothetical protein
MNGPDPADRHSALGRLAWAWWHSGKNVWRQEKWPGHYFFSLDERVGRSDTETRSLVRYPDHVHIGPRSPGHQLTYTTAGKHVDWRTNAVAKELHRQLVPFMSYLDRPPQSKTATGRRTPSTARKTPKARNQHTKRKRTEIVDTRRSRKPEIVDTRRPRKPEIVDTRRSRK